MKNKNNNQITQFKCAFCGKDFSEKEFLTLEEDVRGIVLHATCLNCGGSGIIFVSGNQSGIISLGMATDLDRNEVAGKFFQEPITADEIIDIHQCMSEAKQQRFYKN